MHYSEAKGECIVAKQGSTRSGAMSLGHQRCLPCIIFIGLSLFLVACTSLSPISDDAKTLREQIRSGEAVQQGDQVRIVTRDDMSHRLIVISVENDVLKGRLDHMPTLYETDEPYAQSPEQEQESLVKIPIEDIVLVEKEEFGAAKAVAVVGFPFLIAGIIAFLASQVFVP